jgi:hypothetical protein
LLASSSAPCPADLEERVDQHDGETGKERADSATRDVVASVLGSHAVADLGTTPPERRPVQHISQLMSWRTSAAPGMPVGSGCPSTGAARAGVAMSVTIATMVSPASTR